MPNARRRGRTLAIGCAAALATLPSCATFSLWGREFPTGRSASDAASVERQLVSETTTSARWVLQGEGVSSTGLWAIAEDGSVQHWLRPGFGADVAMALLVQGDLGIALRASLASVREELDGQVARADVTLTMPIDVVEAAVAEPIAANELTPRTRALLDRPRWNAFLQAGDPDLYLPPLLRECVRRLGGIDFTRSLPDAPTAAVLESFVVLDARDLPCYEAGTTVPAGLDVADLPLAERLAALRLHRLVVRVTTPAGDRFLRMRADRLWLASCLRREGKAGVHESRWVLEPPIAARVGRPERPRAELRTDARLTTRTYQLVYTNLTPQRLGPWAKVALTPVAFALDATLLLPVNVVAILLSGSGDDDDRPTQPVRPR
jgi:hypothetical protein